MCGAVVGHLLELSINIQALVSSVYWDNIFLIMYYTVNLESDSKYHILHHKKQEYSLLHLSTNCTVYYFCIIMIITIDWLPM